MPPPSSDAGKRRACGRRESPRLSASRDASAPGCQDFRSAALETTIESISRRARLAAAATARAPTSPSAFVRNDDLEDDLRADGFADLPDRLELSEIRGLPAYRHDRRGSAAQHRNASMAADAASISSGAAPTPSSGMRIERSRPNSIVMALLDLSPLAGVFPEKRQVHGLLVPCCPWRACNPTASASGRT